MHNTTTDTTDLSQLFGLDSLAEEERQAFLDEVGGILLESSVLSFLLTLDEAEHEEFKLFLATAGEGEGLLERLVEAYPEFVSVLETEITKFRSEAEMVLTPSQ